MKENQTPESIGAKLEELVELLKKKGFTNNEGKMNGGVFAKSIGIDPSQFSRVKSGEMGITLKQVMEISSIYGVRIGWLFNGELPVFKEEKEASTGLPAELQELLKKEIDLVRVSLDKIELSLQAGAPEIPKTSQKQSIPGLPAGQLVSGKSTVADVRSDKKTDNGLKSNKDKNHI